MVGPESVRRCCILQLVDLWMCRFYIPYRFLFAIAMAVAMAYYLLLQGMSSILYRSLCLAALTVFV